MIANATEIIPIKAKKLRNHALSYCTCHTLTIATGHERVEKASLIFQFQILLPIILSVSMVRFHSPLISFKAT
jgi:hypothetical protein